MNENPWQRRGLHLALEDVRGVKMIVSSTHNSLMNKYRGELPELDPRVGGSSIFEIGTTLTQKLQHLSGISIIL